MQSEPRPLPWLQLNSVTITYPGPIPTEVVRGLSLELAKGDIGCLLGPSGCGKTTALRAIAGLLPIAEGSIIIGDKLVSTPTGNIPPERRRVGFVFQDYALFPHLTAAANVGFGLRRLDSRERARRVGIWLERVGLSEHANRHPHELSGGQQQRVALARALATEPDLLLMDEPFSNLDVELRERLANEVRGVLKSAGITAVLVTHDQNEAFAMADHIGVLNGGKLEQWDNAYNLYHRPGTRFVADFIGLGVFVPGEQRRDPAGNIVEVSIEIGQLTDARPEPLVSDTQCVDVLLRPDDVIHDDASPLRAEVLRKTFRGAEFLYALRMPSGREFLALVPSHHNHAVGEYIGIRLHADHIVTFAHETA